MSEHEYLAALLDQVALFGWLDQDPLSPSTAAYFRRAAALLREARPQPVPVATPGEQYHEDMGPVLWWRFPIEEPPYVGTPNDSDWPGYHTHYTPVATPTEPAIPTEDPK